MKITEAKHKHVEFYEIDVGDVFYYSTENAYYMRIPETAKYNAVYLLDGTLETFSSNCKVQKVDNAELVV